MKKVIIKKSNKLKVFSLKVENLLFKNEKLILINNFNILNLNSKEINKSLNTKLVNNNIIRGLELDFPTSGLSKIIKFKSFSKLFDIVKILTTNNQFFDILLVKIFNKIYDFSKLNFDKFNLFLINKNQFFKENLILNLQNFNFLAVNFLNLIKNFLFILNNQK